MLLEANVEFFCFECIILFWQTFLDLENNYVLI